MFAVCGVSLSAHYCGGDLESLGLFQQNKGCEDGACGDENKAADDCCKDKTVVAKVTVDQKTASELRLVISQKIIAGLPIVFENDYIEKGVTSGLCIVVSNLANAPPGLWQNIPLHKLHSRFTFYG